MGEFKVPMEIYSRCSGYFRPVSNWNPGKKEEFSQRKKLNFDLIISHPPKKIVTEDELLRILVKSAEV